MLKNSLRLVGAVVLVAVVALGISIWLASSSWPWCIFTPCIYPPCPPCEP
jgi:hypothetical protein